jgi:hypothetical protein
MKGGPAAGLAHFTQEQECDFVPMFHRAVHDDGGVPAAEGHPQG